MNNQNLDISSKQERFGKLTEKISQIRLAIRVFYKVTWLKFLSQKYIY